MTHSLTENCYLTARNALVKATLLDLPRVICHVRLCVIGLLRANGAGDTLVRMALDDLTETLMAKEGLRLANADGYKHSFSPKERFMHMERGLSSFLLSHIFGEATTER